MKEALTNERKTAESIAADIARELRERPDRWTKGELARTAAGLSVDPLSTEAVCWCLEGHIHRRVPENFWHRSDIFNHFKAALGGIIYYWNDQKDRTADDVIALCDQVAGPGAGFAHFHSRSAT